MRLKSRSGLIATAVAVAAIAAPSAQAYRLMSGETSPAVAAHEEGQSFRWYENQPASTPSAVRPNPDEQAPASKSDPASTPSAVRPNPDEQAPASAPSGSKPVNVVPTRLGYRVLSGNLLRTAPVTGHEAPSTAKPAVATSSGSQGFQFDDAGIGAGVMLGLVLLGGGTALVLRRRSQLSQA